MPLPVYTSEKLSVGTIYPRMELQKIFSINDATIKNGIYQPKGTKSVWLFITEDKTKDSTQYSDLLEGDMLTMDGQQSGRTDDKLLYHAHNEVELLVFYRKNKAQYVNYGFKYEGKFAYSSHRSSNPRIFTLYRKQADKSLLTIQKSLDDSDEFNCVFR